MRLTKIITVAALFLSPNVYSAPSDFDLNNFQRDIELMNRSIAKAKQENKQNHKTKLMQDHMELMLGHMNTMMKMMHGNGMKGQMMKHKNGQMNKKGMMMDEKMMGNMMGNMMKQMKSHHDVCMTAIKESK